MKALQRSLDFARPQYQPDRRRRITLLAFALTCGLVSGALAWHVQSVLDQQGRLLEARQQLARRTEAARAAPQRPVQTAQLTAARNMVRSLSVPWDEVFGAIEASKTDKLILDAIRTDVAERSIDISGRASDYPAIAEFLQRLTRQPPLTHAILISESATIDPPDARRFVVKVHWSEVP